MTESQTEQTETATVNERGTEVLIKTDPGVTNVTILVFRLRTCQ